MTKSLFFFFLQMAGLASAVIVLVTILKLGPLFQELPKVLFIQRILIIKKHSLFLMFVLRFSPSCSGCAGSHRVCKSEGNVQAAR